VDCKLQFAIQLYELFGHFTLIAILKEIVFDLILVIVVLIDK
jgi:hypothetical protein